MYYQKESVLLIGVICLVIFTIMGVVMWPLGASKLSTALHQKKIFVPTVFTVIDPLLPLIPNGCHYNERRYTCTSSCSGDDRCCYKSKSVHYTCYKIQTNVTYSTKSIEGNVQCPDPDISVMEWDSHKAKGDGATSVSQLAAETERDEKKAGFTFDGFFNSEDCTDVKRTLLSISYWHRIQTIGQIFFGLGIGPIAFILFIFASILIYRHINTRLCKINITSTGKNTFLSKQYPNYNLYP